MRPPHWHVLGAGAIGCLFASFLQRAGSGTTLILREPPAGSDCTVVVEKDSRRDEFHPRACGPADTAPISHLLVTTKAYDVREAVAAIAHRLDGNSQVLVLVNGMGFAQCLRDDYPWLDLYQGSTTEGAYRLGPRRVRHAGSGHTRLGQPGRFAAPDWFRHWPGVPLSCQWDPQIERALWLKLAINCAINPLSAVHQCRNGQLLTRPELTAQVDMLCAEIALISEAAGYPDLAGQVHAAVRDVIAGTADNQSSMLRDVQQGRRTEIDYITGHLLRVARQHALDAPHNAALLEEVKALAH